MADNRNLAALTGNAAADEVTYSGDTAVVQLVRQVAVTGSEGSKTVVENMPASLGQKAKAASFPVTLASDEDALALVGATNSANGQVAPTSSAATLLAARATRRKATFQNIGSVTVWIGIATVTTANGFPLDPGAAQTIEDVVLWQAITAAGTGAIAYIEHYD